jgi:hypothetical protein
MFQGKRRVGWVLAILVALTCISAGPASSAWVEQGPGPILNGQSEGIPNSNPVSGAVNAIAVDPSDSSGNTVYVGTVNGGVWKTASFLAASPTWTPLTDQALPALSINSLAVSPLDSNTVFAGTGSTSSFALDGSPGFGVARSTDGGATWTVLASSTFTGRQINNIVPTTLSGGQVVLAATLRDGGGVWRSTDGGSSFTQVSGAVGTGLPSGGASSLVSDPTNGSRFYAGVPNSFGGGASAGVYRSVDGGLTWTSVSTGLTGLGTSLRILLSVGPTTGVLNAMIIGTSGTLQGVFQSPDTGVAWTAMGVPSPPIFPGGQGSIHGAIVSHLTNANVVFISGDRQNSPFPNTNGCNNFSGNVFRGDVSLLPGNPWQNVVCNGANGTSPHADSRAMLFDANGDLLQGNDGGIYRLANPNNSPLRTWASANGNVRPTELHSAAYDPVSNVVFGGAQDVGTPIQNSPGSLTWSDLLQGDGGVVAVDGDQVAHPGTSIRYTSFNFLGFFNRSTWNAGNSLVSGPTALGLHITSGPGTGLTLFQFDPNIQFYNPYVLNVIDPSRMLIGTANIYESLDRGDTLRDFGFTGAFIGDDFGNTPLAYGSRSSGVPMPDVFYVGAGSTIFHRVTLGGAITTLAAYPGGTIRALVMDPQNFQKVYVLDTQSRVWASFDEGASWQNLTANLPSLTSSVRTIELFSPNAGIINTVLIAGGQGGVFQMRRPGAAGASWTQLSSGLPDALVFDLHYDYTHNVLVAGTLGRGAWTLTNFFRGGGGTGAGTAGVPLFRRLLVPGAETPLTLPGDLPTAPPAFVR